MAVEKSFCTALQCSCVFVCQAGKGCQWVLSATTLFFAQNGCRRPLQSADKACKRKNYPEKKENRWQFSLPASVAHAVCGHLRSGKIHACKFASLACRLSHHSGSLLILSTSYGGRRPPTTHKARRPMRSGGVRLKDTGSRSAPRRNRVRAAKTSGIGVWNIGEGAPVFGERFGWTALSAPVTPASYVLERIRRAFLRGVKRHTALPDQIRCRLILRLARGASQNSNG